MTDRQIYQRALDELRRCADRAEQLRSFIRTYEELAGMDARKPDAPAVPRMPQESYSGDGDWEEMAATVIRREGRPMRVGEIYEAIVPMGFFIDSRKPTDALATRLNRSRRFSRPGRGLYSVTEEPAAASEDQQPVAMEAERREADESDLWRGSRSAA